MNKYTTLTMQDFIFSLPETFLILSSFILIIFNINYNSTKIITDRVFLLSSNYYLTLQILIITFLLLINTSFLNDNTYIILNGLFNNNFFIIFFKILTIISSILVLLISYQYVIENKTIYSLYRNKYEYSFVFYEYFIITIYAIIGMLLVISSYDIISLYLGLELQSIALYILAAFRKNKTSIEAGLKYFLLGSLASIFILFGFSFLYGLTGLTSFSDLSEFCAGYSAISSYNLISSFLFFFSIFFILIGLCFKLGVVPFHFWLPDVYEGTSTNITAFFAIVTKISLLCIIIKIFFIILYPYLYNLYYLFGLLSVLSMVVGAIGSLFQVSFKRLLAYSSINNVGLILMSLVSGDIFSIMSIFIHLINYMIVSIGLFIILLSCIIDYASFKASIKNNNIIKELNTFYINDLNGLFYSHPTLAIIISMLLFSSAGIPPLVGFFGKYYLLLVTISNSYYLIAGIGILTSVITSIYYIRIIIKMFVEAPINIHIFKNINFISAYILILVVLFSSTFFLFPYPILLLCKIATLSIF
jgi:NADH-quinone oxidoreductase subunit N